MDAIEKRALELLCGEIDLDPEDYDEGERIEAGEALRAIKAALTPPEGYVLMPVEPTAELLAAASVAVWPQASRAGVQMAIKAATIVLRESMDLAPGMTLEMLAASIATMAPAYRAMLAARPEVP